MKKIWLLTLALMTGSAMYAQNNTTAVKDDYRKKLIDEYPTDHHSYDPGSMYPGDVAFADRQAAAIAEYKSEKSDNYRKATIDEYPTDHHSYDASSMYPGDVVFAQRQEEAIAEYRTLRLQEAGYTPEQIYVLNKEKESKHHKTKVIVKENSKKGRLKITEKGFNEPESL